MTAQQETASERGVVVLLKAWKLDSTGYQETELAGGSV